MKWIITHHSKNPTIQASRMALLKLRKSRVRRWECSQRNGWFMNCRTGYPGWCSHSTIASSPNPKVARSWASTPCWNSPLPTTSPHLSSPKASLTSPHPLYSPHFSRDCDSNSCPNVSSRNRKYNIRQSVRWRFISCLIKMKRDKILMMICSRSSRSMVLERQSIISSKRREGIMKSSLGKLRVTRSWNEDSKTRTAPRRQKAHTTSLSSRLSLR